METNSNISPPPPPQQCNLQKKKSSKTNQNKNPSKFALTLMDNCVLWLMEMET
jgi:hypothetical protein